MKRGIVALLVFAVVAGSAFADFEPLSFPPPVKGGSFLIDAGIGLRAMAHGYGSWGYKISIPPLFLQAEYALPVGVPISVGLGFSVAQWKLDLFTDWGYKLTYFTPTARVNWHWGFDVSWLDLFTGIVMGADIAKVKWNRDDDWWGSSSSYSTAASRFLFVFQVGAHFYFAENVGVVFETGYPYFLKAGLALKFGGSGGGTSNRSSKSSSSSSSRSSSKSEYMLVNADALNIRKGPSADTQVVGVAERNARVQVLEKSGQWWKIKHGNVQGYVNSSFLKPAN